MGANQEIIAELRRVLNERDEAREQLYLTKAELGRWVDREAKAVRERDEARASVADAYRRGAEAMRARCEETARHACSVIGKLEHTYGIMTQGHIETVSRLILEADIPEEP